MKNIGEIIENRRKKLGYRIEELATLLEVSNSTISKYTKNRIDFPIQKVEKLCLILKITPNELFGFEPVKQLEIENINQIKSVELKNIIKKLEKCTDNNLKKINKLLSFFLKELK